MARRADEYEWVRRWEIYMGADPHHAKDRQGLAAAENAPTDAIWRDDSGTWLTYRDIESVVTLAQLMRRYPEARAELQPLIMKLCRNVDDETEAVMLEAEADATAPEVG